MLEQVYAAIIRKQAELIQVQHEIYHLKRAIGDQEYLKRSRPPLGLRQFLAMLCSALLIAYLIGVAAFTRSVQSAERSLEQQNVELSLQR
jgi:hypothetical protein